MLGRTYKYLLKIRFTFRKGCLNPAVGIVLQLFASIRYSDIGILFQIYGIVIGSIIGGILAAIFYTKLYGPVLDSL